MPIQYARMGSRAADSGTDALHADTDFNIKRERQGSARYSGMHTHEASRHLPNSVMHTARVTYGCANNLMHMMWR